MPQNLSSGGTSFPTQTAPVGGEPRTASSVATPFQNSTDRTQFVHDRLFLLDAYGEGVSALRSFISLAALTAETRHNDYSCAYVKDYGLYFYDSLSAIAPRTPGVLIPDDVGGSGRWIHEGYLRLNQPGCEVASDPSTGKVVAGLMTNGVLRVVPVSAAAGSSGGAFNTTLLSSVITLQTGDLLTVDASLCSNDASSPAFYLEVILPDTSVVNLATGTSTYRSPDQNTRVGVSEFHIAASNGSYTFRVRAASLSAGSWEVTRMLLRQYRGYT